MNRSLKKSVGALDTDDDLVFADALQAVGVGASHDAGWWKARQGAIASEWGPSENNRRARFYRLTKAGHAQLKLETRDWKQTAAIIGPFFEVKAEDLQ